MKEAKPFLISKREVWEAYQKVKAKKEQQESTKSRLRILNGR